VRFAAWDAEQAGRPERTLETDQTCRLLLNGVAQGDGDFAAKSGEVGVVAQLRRTGIIKRHIEDVEDAPGPARHHYDLRRHVDRFRDRMRDEEAGEPVAQIK